MLSAQQVLQVWEKGQSLSALEQSQELLCLVNSTLTREQTQKLPLGDYHQQLLMLREQLFGHQLDAYMECPKCHEPLDISISTRDVLADFNQYQSSSMPIAVEMGDLSLRVILPTWQDINDLARCPDVVSGRQLLFERCVLSLKRDDQIQNLSSLSAQELDAIEQKIAELDGRMELLFELSCPACEHQWSSPLDISHFLQVELDRYARELLEEVHVLASCYSWHENDILSMSHHRRRYYLERLLQ